MGNSWIVFLKESSLPVSLLSSKVWESNSNTWSLSMGGEGRGLAKLSFVSIH